MNETERHLLEQNVDEEYYLAQAIAANFDVSDPAMHFHHIGWRVYLSPNEGFDTRSYVYLNPDIRLARINPFLHYLKHGKKEYRRLSHPTSSNLPLKEETRKVFDKDFYHKNYRVPNLFASNLFDYFWLYGRFAGQWLNSTFCPTYYLMENPDLDHVGLCPTAHYVNYGIAEQRLCHPVDVNAFWEQRRKIARFFDDQFYANQTDLENNRYINWLDHYLLNSGTENHDPCRLFSEHLYLEANPDLRTGNHNPLFHLLNYGLKEGRIFKPSTKF